jgi:two-component system, NtrC family, response regulator AtoC
LSVADSILGHGAVHPSGEFLFLTGREYGKGVNMKADGAMIGNGLKISAVKEFAGRVARANCNVLVTGETGTGKELMARLIHSLSLRAKGPLVSFNCAAIPDSLLEAELFGHEKGAFTGAWQRNEGRIGEANSGTLFLDEIGEMSLFAQAKVLRSIDSGQVQRLGTKGTTPVDIRLVAATNQNLELMVREGRFRKDLYFRLNVARIELPPLRERSDDVLELADHFLRVLSATNPRPPVGFSTQVRESFLRYSWPGNIRELKNVVEVALVHDPYPFVELKHLPQEIWPLESRPALKPDRERIVNALRISNWNKSEAAKQLRWSRMTLYRKIARYSIEEEIPAH